MVISFFGRTKKFSTYTRIFSYFNETTGQWIFSKVMLKATVPVRL